jgi:RNA polymerase I-specific transcription initiation factor RRN3
MTLLPLLARQTLIDTGLESYFPFDPYDLPRSKEWVDAVYRKWEDVPRPAGMAEDDTEAADEQDATDASDVGEDQDGLSLPSKSSYLSPGAGFGGSLRTGRSLLDGEMLSTSMEGMRISPRTSVLMQTVS